jgi:uncharacterized membrane protein
MTEIIKGAKHMSWKVFSIVILLALVMTVGAVMGAMVLTGNDKRIVVVDTEDYATYQKFNQIINDKQTQVKQEALTSLKTGNQVN